MSCLLQQHKSNTPLQATKHPIAKLQAAGYLKTKIYTDVPHKYKIYSPFVSNAKVTSFHLGGSTFTALITGSYRMLTR